MKFEFIAIALISGINAVKMHKDPSILVEVQKEDCYKWNTVWWKGHSPKHPVATVCGRARCDVCGT